MMGDSHCAMIKSVSFDTLVTVESASIAYLLLPIMQRPNQNDKVGNMAMVSDVESVEVKFNSMFL